MLGFESQDNIPDFFVYILSGCPFFHHCHDDVFCGHERQLLINALLNDSLVDDDAVGNVVQLAERSACALPDF